MTGAYDLNDVVDALTWDFGRRSARGYLCLGHVYGRTEENPKGHWGQQRWHTWTGLRSQRELCSSIDSLVQTGNDVYMPTATFRGKFRRSEYTLPTRVVSFEIDKPRNRAHMMGVLDALGAGLVDSGTPGHLHVRVLLREPLLAKRIDRIGRLIYAACDPLDGGKWDSHDVLRIPGTLNQKHFPPTPVRLLRTPRVIDLDDVKTVLREHKSLLKTATRMEHRATGSIAPEPIEWSAVPARAKSRYRSVAKGQWSDRSQGIWAFLSECRKGGLTPGQIYYAATRLDREQAGVIADKYTANQVETQVHKLFAMNTANK